MACGHVWVKQRKKCSTPLETSTRLRCAENSLLVDPNPYRALVGSLLYLTINRQDIAFSLGYIADLYTHQNNRTWKLQRGLKYINSTSNMGLLLKRKNIFCINWTYRCIFCGDMDNRRSKSCYIFLYSGTRISLCNKKLDSVSLSTMDAEYKQRLLLLKNVYGSKDLLKIWHLSISKPIMIYGDNQSVIKLANNLFHERTKCIKVEHDFIWEKVLDGTLYKSEVRSHENIVDILTKPLPKSSLEFFNEKFVIVSKIHF